MSVTNFQQLKQRLEDNPLWLAYQSALKSRMETEIQELIANGSDAIERPGQIIELSATIKLLQSITSPTFLESLKSPRPDERED